MSSASERRQRRLDRLDEMRRGLEERHEKEMRRAAYHGVAETARPATSRTADLIAHYHGLIRAYDRVGKGDPPGSLVPSDVLAAFRENTG